MEYITVKEATARWGLSDRRVRVLCEQGKINGVIKERRSYLVPADSIKPVDGRSLRNKSILLEFDAIFSEIAR